MRNAISIKEIAALAGVSVATVSRVMNRKGGYSGETEQRVKAVIQANHYIPNMVAKGLRENRVPIIGLLVPDIVNEHFSKFVLEFQNVLFQNGYLTMVFNSNESLSLEQQYFKAMIGQNVSGIVLLTGADNSLSADGIPVVYVDRHPLANEKAVYVESDNQRGGYLAARELIEQGCRRIVFVTDMLQESSKAARYQGYCQALMDAGMELDPTMVLKVNMVGVEPAHQVITESLERGLVFDGIMCTTDMLAVGSILALQKAGMRVPGDVRVTGFDDVSASRLFKVPITTIHQYTDKMAEKVAEVLFALINEENLTERRFVVPVDLIRRESTGHAQSE